MPHQRKQFLIDKRTQWRIAASLVMIWFLGGLAVVLFPVLASLGCGVIIARQPLMPLFGEIAQALWFPVMMAVLVVPIGVWYSIRFSNRIAGPVFRINREIKRLIAGEPTQDVKLRKKDFFKPLAGTFNELRVRVQELEAQVAGLQQADAMAASAGNAKSVSDQPGLPVVPGTGDVLTVDQPVS